MELGVGDCCKELTRNLSFRSRTADEVAINMYKNQTGGLGGGSSGSLASVFP